MNWESIQASVRDIEGLVEIGRKLNACPYYGTRKSIKQCQVMKSLVLYFYLNLIIYCEITDCYSSL